jgi:hypothetical protein
MVEFPHNYFRFGPILAAHRNLLSVYSVPIPASHEPIFSAYIGEIACSFWRS